MTKKEFEKTVKETMENALSEYGGVAGCVFICVSPKGKMSTYVDGSVDKLADALATIGTDEAKFATLLRASIRRMNKLKLERINENIYPFKARL